MTTPAQIQAKVYRGYAIAAKKVGTTTVVYRPTSPVAPMDEGNIVAVTPAAFDNSPLFAFTAPAIYGRPLRYALIDGALLQVGDLLAQPTPDNPAADALGTPAALTGTTYFVASMDALSPIMCVLCNRMVTLTSSAAPVELGVNPPGGREDGTDTVMMSGWPASVLQGTKGENSTARLPGDTRVAWWLILMPYWPGILFHMGDSVRDNLGRKYEISSAELTAFGWRLTAAQEET